MKDGNRKGGGGVKGGGRGGQSEDPPPLPLSACCTRKAYFADRCCLMYGPVLWFLAHWHPALSVLPRMGWHDYEQAQQTAIMSSQVVYENKGFYKRGGERAKAPENCGVKRLLMAIFVIYTLEQKHEKEK